MSNVANEVEWSKAGEAFAVTWLGAACVAIIFYDHVITIRQEIESFWWAKWSIPKVLFLLNRYVVGPIVIFDGIAAAIPRLSEEFCKFYIRWLSLTITIATSITEGILTARVWALYRGHTIVVAAAIVCYACSVLVLVAVTISDYVATGPVQVAIQYADVPGCQTSNIQFLMVALWITPLAIETVFFFLVMWQAFGWWRYRTPTPPTLKLLARDSAIYFACICVLLFINLFVYVYGPIVLSSMFVTPSNTVGCVAGSRILLNMRAIAHQNVYTSNGGRDLELSSNIHFDSIFKPRTRANTMSTTVTAVAENISISTLPSSHPPPMPSSQPPPMPEAQNEDEITYS